MRVSTRFRELASTTARLALLALDQICRYAVRRGWLADNPGRQTRTCREAPPHGRAGLDPRRSRPRASAQPRLLLSAAVRAARLHRPADRRGARADLGRHRLRRGPDPRPSAALPPTEPRAAQDRGGQARVILAPPRSRNCCASADSPPSTKRRTISSSPPRAAAGSTTGTSGTASAMRSSGPDSKRPAVSRLTHSATASPRC